MARRPGTPPSRRGRAGARPAERVVAGLHPVREALRAGHQIQRVHVAASRAPSAVLDDLLSLASDAGVELAEVDRVTLDELAEGAVHQGVVATGRAFPYLDLDELRAHLGALDDPALVVALDGVTDPHNLGSMARTAEAVGAHALVVPARRAAGVTVSAEKAAAGALAHLPVARVPNLVRALEQLGRGGLWSVGLDGAAATSVYDVSLVTEPLVLVVGAEGSGLARLSRVQCDQLVYLPMRGHVGSLNASVAVAVALYEIVRRRAGGGR